MNNYEEYLKVKESYEKAKKWNDMHGKIHGNTVCDKLTPAFFISPAHSEIKLVRSGQEMTGGQNYWSSPAELNKAILNIIREDQEICNKAVNVLKVEMEKALVDCQEFIDDLQEKIKKGLQ
jgi:hypothetical protein